MMRDRSGNKDLYAAVDSRRASPLLAVIDRELRRAHRIATAEGMVGEDEVHEVAQSFHVADSSRLIDLGCGSAGPSGIIAQAVHCRVVAVDINAARLARIDRTLPIEPLCADLNLGIPLRPASIDGAMQFDSIVHIESKEHYLRTVRELLRPGSHLALTSSTNGPIDDHWRRRLGDVPGTIWRLSTDALIADITNAGFSVEIVRSRRAQVLGWHESRREALTTNREELLREMRLEDLNHALDRSTSVARLLADNQIDMVFMVASRH